MSYTGVASILFGFSLVNVIGSPKSLLQSRRYGAIIQIASNPSGTVIITRTLNNAKNHMALDAVAEDPDAWVAPR